MRHVLGCLILAMLMLFAGDTAEAQAPTQAPPTQALAQAQSMPVADEYTERIKPIFDGRCVACHSCTNAPCQLNLQTYSGAARGATRLNVYDAKRAHSVPPSRIDIDASTPAEWRTKGFTDILGSGSSGPGRSLLLDLTKLRAAHASRQPGKPAADSQFCSADASDERIAGNPAQLGMPYGLPPLSGSQIAALQAWIEHGAPGPASSGRPERDAIPQALREQVASWEAFLNGPDPRQKLVSRYLYEHLFLAHLHFAPTASAAPRRPAFFRLVRSRTACDRGVEEIATARPTDAPPTPAPSCPMPTPPLA